MDDELTILDQQGQERGWDWLAANFGTVSLQRAELPEEGQLVFRAVKVQDSEGPAVQVVNVADQDGNPLEGVRVVRYWPDAPPLPVWPPPTSRWHEQGVHGETKTTGEVGFGMGHGDYYFPPSGGASAVWVAAETGPSDLISGLGMLGGTNHRHLDVYYRLASVEDPSPPSPPPEPSQDFVIVDKDGQLRDLLWLEWHFGVVEHHKAPEPPAYRLAELREVVDSHTARVKVLDEQGRPLPGINVSYRRWDGTAGSAEKTDADGAALFALEEDARYPVPGKGPYLAMVKRVGNDSDAVIGLGQVSGTPRHLDVTFELRSGEGLPPSPPPEVKPPDEWWDELFDRLDRITVLLEEYLE